MTTPAEMDQLWESKFPESLPQRYALLDAYEDRWVRFHSLPDSKRYPDSAAELRTVLDRHYAILSAIPLPVPKSEVILVTAGYSTTPEPFRCGGARVELLDPDAEWWRSIALHELFSQEEPEYDHLFVSSRPWCPNALDALLEEVAYGKMDRFMILSPRSNCIYSPYDGGADAILASPSERDRLKNRFKDWLSPREDGL